MAVAAENKLFDEMLSDIKIFEKLSKSPSEVLVKIRSELIDLISSYGTIGSDSRILLKFLTVITKDPRRIRFVLIQIMRIFNSYRKTIGKRTFSRKRILFWIKVINIVRDGLKSL